MDNYDKHNPKGCAKCIYRSKRGETCNFFFITGATRNSQNAPLLPGGGCRLKRTERRKENEVYPKWNVYTGQYQGAANFSDETRSQLAQKEIDYEQVKRLYDRGFSDREIARRAGIDKKSVYSWRKRLGLESNYVISKREICAKEV